MLGGRVLCVHVTTNLKPQQRLIWMIFTNADPRYAQASRIHDKQGCDTIVTMERVREAITFNAELADESIWLWLTSEQMPGWEGAEKRGFLETKPLHTHQKGLKKISGKNRYSSRILIKGFEHIELPAKLLDYFLQSNKRNINQSGVLGTSACKIVHSAGVVWYHYTYLRHNHCRVCTCACVCAVCSFALGDKGGNFEPIYSEHYPPPPEHLSLSVGNFLDRRRDRSFVLCFLYSWCWVAEYCVCVCIRTLTHVLHIGCSMWAQGSGPWRNTWRALKIQLD